MPKTPDSRVTLSITDLPEVLVATRRELATILREVAADEDPRVAARLREIAAIFETGQPTNLTPD